MGGREDDKKCPKWEFQFSNSASRQSLLVSHLLHSQFILWWRELPKSGAGDPAVSQLGLSPSNLPSKHRLLPKRSFNRVQSWGFLGVLCETDFDCRSLLQLVSMSCLLIHLTLADAPLISCLFPQFWLQDMKIERCNVYLMLLVAWCYNLICGQFNRVTLWECSQRRWPTDHRPLAPVEKIVLSSLSL